jgi:hypothetical protein
MQEAADNTLAMYLYGYIIVFSNHKDSHFLMFTLAMPGQPMRTILEITEWIAQRKRSINLSQLL